MITILQHGGKIFAWILFRNFQKTGMKERKKDYFFTPQSPPHFFHLEKSVLVIESQNRKSWGGGVK